MEDSKIVQLYWNRDEQAIGATADKYGRYCASIARNILGNREDAEECVNDTYLNAWNAIPPHRPGILSAFLGKITRNLSFNRYQYNTADKRGGGNLPLVLWNDAFGPYLWRTGRHLVEGGRASGASGLSFCPAKSPAAECAGRQALLVLRDM